MVNVNEQSYEEMIQALNVFAQTMETEVGNMVSLVRKCCYIMDGDEAVSKASTKMRDVEKAYLEGAKEALSISQAMSQELEEYQRIKAEAYADD